MSAQGTHATEKPWRELLVGQPLRLQPQQLLRQRGKEGAKVKKAPDPRLEDAAKEAVEVRTRRGQRAALVLPVMNGKRPGNVQDPVALMPTHLVVEGARVVDQVDPAGEERAKAVTDPLVQGPAVLVLLNLVNSSQRGHARTVTNVGFRMMRPPHCPWPETARTLP